MNKRILLVDDDEVFNFLSEKTLTRLGIAKDIRSVLNGKEALELLQSLYEKGGEMPDIILLDLNMPIMDGFRFIEEFNGLMGTYKNKIMIAIVTSSSNPKDLSRARELGITHYLVKPLSVDDILRVCS